MLPTSTSCKSTATQRKAFSNHPDFLFTYTFLNLQQKNVDWTMEPHSWEAPSTLSPSTQ